MILEKTEKLTTYYQVVNDTAESDAIEYVRVEARLDIKKLQAARGHIPCQILDSVIGIALYCYGFYEDVRLKNVFIKKLHESVRLSMRTY